MDDHDAPPAGLFGTLLDLSFDALITPRLLRMLYTLAMTCISGIAAVVFWFGWSITGAGWWSELGWVLVVGTPPLWLAALVLVRVVAEYLIVQHKISTDLTIIRKALTSGRDQT
ncbi:DUF4282 domain-containing protein [Actinoallomurus purpureus]|uniref:DUF4282 domain-containing protein n=1 Tax=Actinoallomurus purpureus TaxID=478114 RepID=UPI0020928770|nr:DUF4282 domain-containing protein [Actinoallomurus purpureus]MCO6011728.1 DUF4282 domain-containing protein [Actinoallomurus purpureus]